MSAKWYLPLALGCVGVLLCIVALLVSCSDDNPTGPDPVMADVDTYMSSLPSWNAFCPPMTDCDSSMGETVENLDMAGGIFCRTTPCSITETPEQIVTYGTFSNILWLGGLIQGDSYAGGVGSMEELPIRQRAPLTIGINLLTGDSVTTTVQNPTAATVGQATSSLVATAQNTGLHGGSSVYFSQKQMFSLEQGMLSLGLSVKYMGAEVSNKLDLSMVQKKNTLSAYFKQVMFETYMVLPQTPSELFTNEFTQARLQEQVTLGNVGPDNLPVYVARVQWGRIMILTMSSDSSVVDMANALKATYAGYDVDLTAKYQHILQTSEMEVVTFGGNDADALALIRSGNIGSYFADSPDLTTAYPIAYALNNLADNSTAKVGETTAYEKKECSQVTAQHYHDWTEWVNAFSAVPDSSDNIFFATNATNINKASEGANWGWTLGTNTHLKTRTLTFTGARTGFDFDFYLHTLQDACSFPLTFNDDEFSAVDMLSIGDADNCQYDAFEIGVGNGQDGAYVFAIGVYIADNGVTSDEKFEAFWNDRKILDVPYSDLLPSTPAAFLGIVSAIPITRIVFTEGYDGDDIYIKNFCFGVAYR